MRIGRPCFRATGLSNFLDVRYYNPRPPDSVSLMTPKEKINIFFSILFFIKSKRETVDQLMNLKTSYTVYRIYMDITTWSFKSVVRITNRNISASRVARDKFEISICSIFSAVLFLLLHFSLTYTLPCHFLFCC